MRFHVPQFIEKESKLIGPLTLRQFLWFLGGGTMVIITQFFFSGATFILITAVILVLTACMAYVNIGGVSLPKYFVMAINYLISGKKYVFEKEEDQRTYQTNTDVKR